jgi:hypothetical protein
MKLNDPFGRMESRHKLGYESMRDTMRKSGVDTPKAAWEVIEHSKKRALNYIVIGIALLLMMTLLLPKTMPVTLSLGIFMVVWISNSALNGKRYIKRYIDEELDVSKNNDS